MSNLLNEFCNELNQLNLVGNVLEFGTGSGRSTEQIVNQIPNRKIITFDGFQGLPKTNKIVPKNTPWGEGQLKFNEDETRARLSKYSNIHIHKCMTYELKNPEFYSINLIAGVNIDLDLYEGTMDALHFCDKCNWQKLLLRFDDWGAYPHQNKHEVSEHEEAAFNDFIHETKYSYTIFEHYKNLSNGLQNIILIER